LLAPAASAEEWGEFTREELFATHFEEAPEASAVVLLDHRTVRIDEKFRLKLSHHRRTKIFGEAGTARAEVRIPYGDGEEIKDFRAHTVVPPDRQVKVEGKHVRDEKSGEGMVRIFTFPDVRPGVILEYSYELRSKRIDVLDPWFFENEDFTRQSRLDLQLPPGLSHRAFFGWSAEAPPKPITRGINDPKKPERKLIQTTWSMEDLPAYRAEPLTPNAADHRLTLYVQLQRYESTYEDFEIERSWAELGRLVAANWESAGNKTEEAKAWAGASVDGVRDPEGKARALYQRVRDGIRTEAPANVSVESVLPLGEVIRAEAGTPLAKNLILAQLLGAYGIEASVVLVATRDHGTFQPNWRTASQLNHAIVRVQLGTESVFLDASVSSCPFGVLPPNSMVAKGVALGQAGGEIVAVESRPVESARGVITSAELDGSGDLVVQSTWTVSGYPAFQARAEIVRDGALAHAERLIRARFPDATVESVGLSGESDEEGPLEVETTFRVAGYATKKGFDLACGAPFVFAGADNPLGTEERVVPVTFDYPWRSEETLTLRLPKGLYVPKPPAESGTRTREVSFSVRYDAKGSTLEGKRRFRIKEQVVEDSSVGQLQDLYGQLALADRAQFTVKRQPMRSSSPSSTH
jgi:transglutaminase-like putative cysteine protease